MEAYAKSVCSILLSMLFALIVCDNARALSGDENNKLIGAPIGVLCKEDPSCVIIGGTHILEWKSPNPEKIVVVCIHGLGLCARAYKPLAKELSLSGIDGYGVNVRGFGPDRDQSERAKLNCTDTVKDVTKLLKDIRTEHPDYKIFLIGESMGGALSIRIAAKNPDLVNGIVCSAPAWKLLKLRRTAVKGVFELVLFPSKHPGFASRGVIKQATADKDLALHWLHDPSHKMKLSFGEATRFLKFISKTDDSARQLETPVLIIQGLNDHLVSPKSVAKIFNFVPSSNKTFLIVGEGEHLVLEEGKFTSALVERLVSWLKKDSDAQLNRKIVEVIDKVGLSPDEDAKLTRLLNLAKSEKFLE